MNPVFWFLVIIVCLAVWYSASSMFLKIGDIATKMIAKVKENINK